MDERTPEEREQDWEIERIRQDHLASSREERRALDAEYHTRMRELFPGKSEAEYPVLVRQLEAVVDLVPEELPSQPYARHIDVNIFVQEYLKTFNAAEAAKRAGSQCKSVRGLARTGNQLLKSPVVNEAIAQVLAARVMTPSEVLDKLGMIARGNQNHFVNERGEVDLATDLAQAHMHELKKIKQREYRRPGQEESTYETEIELHDPVRALELMSKHYGLLLERTQNLNVNIDVTKLTTEQLQRVASGEPLAVVLATTRESGVGETTKTITAGSSEGTAESGGVDHP